MSKIYNLALQLFAIVIALNNKLLKKLYQYFN